MASWTHSALSALPCSDGIPDDRAKASLLRALGSIPDPSPGGTSNLEATEALRATLSGFAQLCRRMSSADDFELACYEWK